MNDHQLRSCKDSIILNVLNFIDTDNQADKETALLDLEKMEKYFRSVKLKKTPKKPIKTALCDFISNQNGYLITVPQLQRALE